MTKVPASNDVDPDWKGLYDAGGISWIIVGVLYFVEIPLFFSLASSLSSADTVLNNLPSQAQIARLTIGLAIVSHLFSVPGILSLYLSLKGINKNAMIVAVAFLGLFIVLDLAVSTPNFLALITLSEGNLAASSITERVAYIVTTNYVFGIFSSSTAIYGSLVPSIGVLITGLVMMRGVFSRALAYLGTIAGSIGIVASLGVFVPAFSLLDVVNLILFGIWLVLVGWKLFKLGNGRF